MAAIYTRNSVDRSLDKCKRDEIDNRIIAVMVDIERGHPLAQAGIGNVFEIELPDAVAYPFLVGNDSVAIKIYQADGTRDNEAAVFMVGRTELW